MTILSGVTVNEMDYKEGYDKEMGRLMAQARFKAACAEAESRQAMIGLMTGQYQPQPDGTVKQMW